ncbi:O-linked N-acetylglucosamine transferase, SPINDLY family protein [Thiolapillus brandeum]|uniref:protein O-GlcNAc transferase n=1 Tax=Thiolapillus brandeum TaxID=1076588 RepID=A0A7U6GH54_9GAMM|nr:tetratricopeptide repeat protein [Thiolapillus brandeum]BAO43530.1 conserved hypothetical protein [Thiolapillus brandeum]
MVDGQSLITLGNTFEDEGQLDKAEQLYRQALQYPEVLARARVNLGNIASARGDGQKALENYRKAVSADPDYAGGYANLGRLHFLNNQFEAAVSQYRKAAALLHGPAKAEILVSLGNALNYLEQREEARKVLEEALSITPGHPWAHKQLGHILMVLKQLPESMDHLNKALEALPDDADIYTWLGKVLCDQGFVEDSVQHLKAALDITPDHIYLRGMAIFTMNYLPGISGEALYNEHLDYADRFCKPFYPKQPVYANTPEPERRLRVGYVSSDFRTHPVSVFLEPLLEQHDRNRFEIHCFYNNRRIDGITTRLKKLSDRWHEIADRDDEAVASLIKSEGIDILVDLNGLTDGHRLLVFARKPAPIQMTWLGYLGTTGLQTMDYRICDRFTDPPGLTEKFHTEILLRMPDSQWCYRCYEELPPVGPQPMDSNGYPLLGSFNNVAKLNDEVLELWAQILNRLPHAKIAFAGIPEGYARERILKKMGGAGIVPERIGFLHRVSYREYLAAISKVDIALDPFPYNGGTTSVDTLVMGVPLVSLEGGHSIARGGCSLLSNLGLQELLAANKDEYIEKACRLVGSPDYLRELRRTLRERVEASPLMDSIRFTMALEENYRRCWVSWCNK